ncbi:MAG: 2'-5' RNA ligase [Omnitrophica bacterium RIFCSPHIGHO2_02_FULL_51_18]|nr:MAG: 2'-5' RNA ligase [Omnitrophica bacterium RIFCSPHIGHO2_02_FULL_51_18]
MAGALSWMRTFGDCIKIVPAENYHLTLKFLGAIGVERISGIQTALEAAAQNVSACDLRLDGWGVFPPRGAPKVFWIGVEPREVLVPIFERCEAALENLGFARETRDFQSHVTLVRTDKAKAPADLLERWKKLSSLSGPVAFCADKITLYESILGGKASVYRPLGHFKFCTYYSK